jgi:hypothetical protein
MLHGGSGDPGIGKRNRAAFPFATVLDAGPNARGACVREQNAETIKEPAHKFSALQSPNFGLHSIFDFGHRNEGDAERPIGEYDVIIRGEG